MLAKLLTEQRNPASQGIDTLGTEAILRIMNAEDAQVAAAVADAIPQIARAVDRIAETLAHGGRLFYIGAGTSGRLGVLDASECPPTFNAPPDLVQGIMAGGEHALAHATEASEDDAASGERDLLAHGFTGNDAVIGIAASGRTPYVLGAVAKARGLGAVTAGISCTPQSELSRAVEFPIEIPVGPEVITGSTRLKAGTASKMALNMISTTAMIRLGHVFGNLMVNVQPKNEKLRDRAIRIITEAAGVSYDRAERLLDEGGSVKAGIVMALDNISAEAAQRKLAEAGGILGRALQRN